MSADALLVHGRVVETCHGSITVDATIGERTHRVLCRLSGRLSVARIRCLPGDCVEVEISPYDVGRGRVVYRGRRRERGAA